MSGVTQLTTLADLGISGSALDFKGDIDCSANPNYPAAGAGDNYLVTVAGKIGGASGTDVEVGDMIICKTASAAGTQAAVGANWFVLDAEDPLTLQILGTLINSATEKATPIDADMVGLMDSAAGNIVKKLSWLNIKATLKTYFDTLYQAVGSYLTASSTDTLTNKTIDANGTGNSITNLEVADFAAGVVDTDLTSTSASHDTLVSALAAKTYADGLVAGLLDDRGSYDASVNTFPASGGSGTAGAVLKGDIWFISVAGTLGGVAVEIGDSVRALADTPGQTASNWSVLNTNLTYIPENVANKDASGGYVGLDAWKIKFRNAANSFTSFLVNAATAARTYTFPDKDGTVAMLDDITSGPTLVRKTADQTVNNSTTLVNDNHLSLAVGANEVWAIFLCLRISQTSGTPGFKFKFTAPAAAALKRQFAYASAAQEASALSDNSFATAAVSDIHYIEHMVYIGGGTAGTLQLQWAQNVANASDTKLIQNTYMICHKLAS